MTTMKNCCRFCNSTLKHTFVDLGGSPLANSYLTETKLHAMEAFFPLHVYVCEECKLVQLPEWENPDKIFSDYAYFSSYSDSWLSHAKEYCKAMVQRFGFDANSHVVEIASNDGYLLQYFKEYGIPVLGIEPARNVAEAAEKIGIPTICKFFGEETASVLAENNRQADLLIGNNVLAHVPNLNDFVKGMKKILNTNGIITMEFPHLLCLMAENQFDTIYHEHFSYFSFHTVNKVFLKHGLMIFDVDEISTHGGSLRIYACHAGDKSKEINSRVGMLLKKESDAGFEELDIYLSFNKKVKKIKKDILDFFIRADNEGKSIACYGAPAKGNTLLNYCGVRNDFISFTVDRSPHKQGLFLPGTRIPIHATDKVENDKPDYLVILPWNLKEEIMSQMSHIRDWGGKFVVFIPEVRIFQ